jgi:hypothetical protein
MRTHRWSWALAAALLASCAGYGAPDEVLYGEAVYTQPRPSFDYQPLGTYFLNAQYLHFEDDLPVTSDLPANVKTAIDSGMQGLGYTVASGADTADVQLGVTVLDGTAAVYYPGYWCDYWYYYSCYYDWYYAGSYKYGTAILEMTDVRGGLPEGSDVPVVWIGAVYGVATTPSYDTQRIADGFTRAFGQSPYLDTH